MPLLDTHSAKYLKTTNRAPTALVLRLWYAYRFSFAVKTAEFESPKLHEPALCACRLDYMY